MKKNILALLALILALAGLVPAVFTCLEVRMQAARISELEAELLGLKAQISETQPMIPDTPAEPEDGECYCNLYLGDWTCDGGALTLTTAFAQVVTTADRPLAGAALILEVNGEAFSTVILDMHPGEASDSYELDLAGFPLDLPELAHGDHLDLYLEATLTDGTVLNFPGGSWDWENGRLLMIAG